MNLKMAIVALVAVGLMVFTSLAMASPPVPPPLEGFNIPNNVDVEMSVGDWTKMEQFIPTWAYDIEELDSYSLAHPAGDHRPWCAPMATGECIPCDGYVCPDDSFDEERNTGIRRTFGDILDDNKLDEYLSGDGRSGLLPDLEFFKYRRGRRWVQPPDPLEKMGYGTKAEPEPWYLNCN